MNLGNQSIKIGIIYAAIGAFFFLSSFSASNSAWAMSPSVRVILSVSTYGAIGGGLLGTAAMAFGAKPRSVAQGASIGLYAGLLFSSYIVLSHEARSRNWGTGDGAEEEEPQLPAGKGGGDEGFFPFQEEDSSYYRAPQNLQNTDKKNDWEVYLPVVAFQF